MALHVRAPKPPIDLASADELRIERCCVARIEGAVIVIHQSVKPGISLEPLIAVVDFPGLFAARLANGGSDAISLVVGGSARILHVFAHHLERKLSSVTRKAVQLVRERSGPDDGVYVVSQEPVRVPAIAGVIERLNSSAEALLVGNIKRCHTKRAFKFRSPFG